MIAIQSPRRTSPQAAVISRRSSQTKMPSTTIAATAVAKGLIKSITATQPMAPRNESIQWTRNFGRYDGLPRNSSVAATTFTAPYAVRKNMVSTGAM